MRLALSEEQTRFGAALDDLLGAAGVPEAARRWAAGDHAPGLAIWRRLADVGVTALAVPERSGGLGAAPADLVVACEALGYHAVPGPVAETLAAVPTLLSHVDDKRWLPALAAGDLLATLAAPPALPYPTDTDAAGLVLVADPTPMIKASFKSLEQHEGRLDHGEAVAGSEVVARGEGAARAVARALDMGALACAAQLLGAGRALLAAATGYARTRVQFGRPIGSFQAVQHRLADVAVALEFARPLLYAAAVTLAPRDISAAKVACGEAAYRAARAALQVHGAIGYTAEHDLGLWLTKVRALRFAWGTPAEHRARVVREVTRGAD